MTFGAHGFIWEGEWTDQSAARVTSEASRLGLDIVEIPLLHPESFDSAGMRQLLSRFRVEAAYSLGLPAESSLPDHPAAAEVYLRQAVDAVAAAGGDSLSGVVYGTLGELPGRRPTDDDYRVIAAVLRSIAKYAAEKGVRIGIEPVNRYETFLVNTIDQALSLIERIGSENVFIHADTYHLNIEEDSFYDAIVRAGDLLGYIHLSESHRGTPGKGTVIWDDVFRGLRDIGFSGPMIMESFVKLNPDIARATCMWRDIVVDADAMITEGIAFLTAKAHEYELA